MQILPEITMMINTTPCDALPGKMSPYEAFYGRKPPQWDSFAQDMHFQRAEEAGESIAVVEGQIVELSDDEVATDDDTAFQTALEKRIAENHGEVANRMVGKRGGDQTMVIEGQIVLFEFPKQMRTSLEPRSIPARIVKLSGVVSRVHPHFLRHCANLNLGC